MDYARPGELFRPGTRPSAARSQATEHGFEHHRLPGAVWPGDGDIQQIALVL